MGFSDGFLGTWMIKLLDCFLDSWNFEFLKYVWVLEVGYFDFWILIYIDWHFWSLGFLQFWIHQFTESEFLDSWMFGYVGSLILEFLNFWNFWIRKCWIFLILAFLNAFLSVTWIFGFLTFEIVNSQVLCCSDYITQLWNAWTDFPKIRHTCSISYSH